MGEEKRNKIVAAVTVNAILLVFIIAAVIVFQIIHISVLNNKKKELYQDLARIQREYEETEDFWLRWQYEEDFRKIHLALAKLGEDTSGYELSGS